MENRPKQKSCSAVTGKKPAPVKDNAKSTQSKKTVKTLMKLRKIVLESYVFGYRSRNDFAKLGFSGRSYDDYKRKLENCLDEHYFEPATTKTKQLRLKSDIYNHAYNYLIDILCINSITSNYYAVILVLQIMSGSKVPMTLKDISKRLEELYPDLSDELSDSILPRALKTLVSYGWIKKLNPSDYIPADNFLTRLSLQEIKELHDAVNFYKNVSFLISPGYFLMHTLENYAYCRYGERLRAENHFQYRHHNLSRIMDDEHLYGIRNAILAGRSLVCKKASDKYIPFSPAYVKTTYPYNRQKIVSNAGQELSIYEIESLTPAETLHDTGPIRRKGPKHYIELVFTFLETDDEREVTHIKNRILSETSWMECKLKTDTKWVFRAKVYDYLQYIPWIRTFHKFVSFGPDTSEGLVNKISKDRTEALKNYGIV